MNRDAYPLRRSARGLAEYAFKGRILKVSHTDFELWKQTYTAIPDLVLEMTSIDGWLVREHAYCATSGKRPPDPYNVAIGWINTKHQEKLSIAQYGLARSGLIELCGSQIEQQFLAAFVLAWTKQRGEHIHYWEPGMQDTMPQYGGILGAQVTIGPYRTDFLLAMCRNYEMWIQIAIECDGHDYHERTKEQAKRDRGRDRWLQEAGFVVFRFTGSEIWRDAARCADEVLALVRGREDRRVWHEVTRELIDFEAFIAGEPQIAATN